MRRRDSPGMRFRLSLAVGLALLVAPAVANADSIVYIDQGNVWTASPDGAHKVQLTTGGQWHSPTQADNGTIAAVEGTGPITVMAPDGRPLHTITTPQAKSGDGGTFAPRPVDLSFSPDGSKLAYSYVASSCPVASTCGTIQRSTFYTEAGVTDATPISVYGNQFGSSDPEWVTNTRTLVFGGYGRQVAIDDLDAGDYNATPWMVPNGDMGDGELSRDGKRFVAVSDYGANTTIAFFAVSNLTEYPELACAFTQKDERYADPTWAPDNAGIAWESSAGITVSRFTAFGPGTCALPNDITLSATGSQPDWGPANPPAAAYTPPGSTPQPTPPAPPVPQPAKPVVKLAIVKLKGKTVTVTVPGAGKAKAVITRRGKKLATGSATAKSAGTLTIRLNKAPRGKSLTLKLTFSGKTISKKV
jgi:hypothetical protein